MVSVPTPTLTLSSSLMASPLPCLYLLVVFAWRAFTRGFQPGDEVLNNSDTRNLPRQNDDAWLKQKVHKCSFGEGKRSALKLRDPLASYFAGKSFVRPPSSFPSSQPAQVPLFGVGLLYSFTLTFSYPPPLPLSSSLPLSLPVLNQRWTSIFTEILVASYARCRPQKQNPG